MKPSGFDKLPTEILRMIVDNLNPDMGESNWCGETKLNRSYLITLFALCLTSKRAYNAAMPVLYYNLPFLQAPSQLEMNGRAPDNFRWKRRVKRFVRSITENNALGRFVRAATFTHSIVFRLAQVTGLFTDLVAPVSALSPTFRETADRIRKESNTDELGVFMATLLLARLPNVTQLVLPEWGDCVNPYLLGMLGVQSMKIKCLKGSATKGHFVQFLNMLPNLESLDLGLILPETEAGSYDTILSDEAWQTLWPLPKLTVLRLLGAMLPNASPLQLQRAPGNFSFGIDNSYSNYNNYNNSEQRQDNYPVASVADVIRGLTPHYKSLHSFELFPSPSANWPLAGPDLGCFSQLQRLSITIPSTRPPTLPFWETLPRTIRHLEITADTCKKDDKEVIAKMIALAQEQLQSPKPYLWLNHVECTAGDDETNWTDVKAAFALVDIVFSALGLRCLDD